ncbi:MAG: B-box zinc finger protein [Bryobacteraceae bacterium]
MARCYAHNEVEAAAYCRACGRPLCAECQRLSLGSVYCPEHVPAATAATPPSPSIPTVSTGGPSPVLAFLLGFIPGVGAVYNGQYVKGLVHVVVLGTLISLTNSAVSNGLEPLFGLLISLWFFYMAFEAYHTAKQRLQGLPVDEFSSLVPLRSPRGGSLAGPIALIVLGVLFLLMTMYPEWVREILRWWPTALIAIGVYLLLVRLRTRQPDVSEEAPHEFK